MHGARDGLGRLVAALLTVTALLTAFLVQPAAADPVLGPPPATLTVSQRSTMAIATWPAVGVRKTRPPDSPSRRRSVASTQTSHAEARQRGVCEDCLTSRVDAVGCGACRSTTILRGVHIRFPHPTTHPASLHRVSVSPCENHPVHCAVRGALAASRLRKSRAAPGTPLGSCRKKASVVYT